MKFLLLIAVLAVAYFFWRSARLEDRSASQRRQPPPAGKPQEMVSCPVCGLHLPQADAVAGSNGVLYCSQEHRLRAGG
jgi:uncharacterized protein